MKHADKVGKWKYIQDLEKTLKNSVTVIFMLKKKKNLNIKEKKKKRHYCFFRNSTNGLGLC